MVGSEGRMLYGCSVSFGADPTVDRLRDVLGTLRCLYAAAPSRPDRVAIAAAASEIKGALGIAQSRSREKELGLRLRNAGRALQRAAEAAPWAAPAILGALSRLPRIHGHG